MRRVIGALCAAVLMAAGATVLLPAGAAQAATVYTWTHGYDATGDPIPGADHTSWTDPLSWSPSGVPGDGDSVVLNNAHGYDGSFRTTTLTAPAGVALAALSVGQVSDANVYLQGGPVTVTGDFEWTAGRIHTPVTVAGNGVLAAGQTKYLDASNTQYGALIVTGTLLLDDMGGTDADGLSASPNYGGDLDGIRVAAGGTLRATGTNVITGTGCCVDPAKIVVDGTIEVTGTTVVRATELTLHGTTRVARGSTLASTIGSNRLGANAVYTGGGTVDFTASASIRANPLTEPVPGGTLMEGMGTLQDNTRIHLGPSALLTGVGGFTGKGVLDVSSPPNDGNRSATIYAELTTGPTTTLRIGGKVPSRLDVYNPSLKGYTGRLHIGGPTTLAPHSTFITGSGTSTTVTKGATLTLGAASKLGEGSCCVDPARLTVAKGAKLVVPGTSGSAPTVTRTDLRLQGTLQIAAGKKLVTSGHPTRLGGTLKVAGRAKPAKQVVALKGDQFVGRFSCVRPAGRAVSYTRTSVRVTGIMGKSTACIEGAGKKIGTKSLGKHQTWRLKATQGVKKSAKKVLLAVTVTGVKKAGKIRVQGVAAFKAAKGKKTVRYVVAKRNAKKVTITNQGPKPVRITVVLLGAA